jgi:hypothetical protein
MAVAPDMTVEGWLWCCLVCRDTPARTGPVLHCPVCGTRYPTIDGMPILVRSPSAYVRREIEALRRIATSARQQLACLDGTGRDAGLPHESLDRHRDVLQTDIARADLLLGLLEPSLAGLDRQKQDRIATHRSGWALEALLPHLLRNWTGTDELRAMAQRIAGVLDQVPREASVIFARCGSAGLLAEIPFAFQPVLGFDLALPVLAAARHLLSGANLTIPMPRAVSPSGRLTLRGRSAPVLLAAMDAFDTAFPDASVDCVVTTFLLDLIPEPRRLAREVNRILRDARRMDFPSRGPRLGARRISTSASPVHR